LLDHKFIGIILGELGVFDGHFRDMLKYANFFIEVVLSLRQLNAGLHLVGQAILVILASGWDVHKSVHISMSDSHSSEIIAHCNTIGFDKAGMRIFVEHSMVSPAQ